MKKRTWIIITNSFLFEVLDNTDCQRLFLLLLYLACLFLFAAQLVRACAYSSQQLL